MPAIVGLIIFLSIHDPSPTAGRHPSCRKTGDIRTAPGFTDDLARRLLFPNNQ